MTTLPTGLHGAHLRPALLREIGENRLRAAVKHGELVSFTRTVLVDPNKLPTLPTRAAVALLSAGPAAVLTGATALALRGMWTSGFEPVHVLVRYARRLDSRPGIAVHHGSIEEQDVDEVGGLRVIAVDLALAEVLCRGRGRDALACADQVLANTPTDARAELKACVAARIAVRPDPRGRRRGQQLLELATGKADSPAESWTLLVIVDAGLPRPVVRHPIFDLSGRERYRLDLAWPELMIAVEYDGYEAHEGRALRDAEREADLRRRGWLVVRASSADLRDPSRLLAAIRAAFAARGAAVAA